MHPEPNPALAHANKPRAQLLIDNVSSDGDPTRQGEVRSPASGVVVGTFAWATPTQLDAAVQAADRAWRAWAARPGHERETVIRKATAHARTKADEIGRLMALEQGKPYAQSRSEVIGSCDIIDYYAAEAVRITGEINPTEKSSDPLVGDPSASGCGSSHHAVELPRRSALVETRPRACRWLQRGGQTELRHAPLANRLLPRLGRRRPASRTWSTSWLAMTCRSAARSPPIA